MAGVNPVANSLEEIARNLAPVFSSRNDQYERAGTFPHENYEDLRRAGYHLATVPERYGGRGASLTQIVQAQMALGQGCGSTTLVMSMHLAQIARAFIAGWSQPHLDEVMHGVVEKGYIINSAQTEPTSGSPSRGGMPTTTATPTTHGFKLNGHKTWCSGSPVLHYIVVNAALSQPEEGTPTVCNFLITRAMPGVKIEETWDTLGMRLTASHDLLLDNVELPAEALLNRGAKLSPGKTALNGAWQLAIAAVYLGVGRAAAHFASQYARNHQPSSLSKPISSLPHIQEKAGRMELALLTAETLLLSAAEAVDNATKNNSAEQNAFQLTALVGAAKYQATNLAIEAVDHAMRLVGGAALSMHAPLQRYYRDVRAGLGNPPMDDVALANLGKYALKLY